MTGYSMATASIEESLLTESEGTMSKLSILAVLIVSFLVPAVARAADHTRTLAAAQTTLAGWPGSNAIDGNPGSVWSSEIHWTPDAYEWFAFWFDGFRETDYVRIVPRMWSGASLHVPEHVNVLYSANGVWNPLTTISLPTTIPAEGQTFPIPRVMTNGLLFTTSRLRPGPSGEYYFQLAEVFGGDSTISNCVPSAPIGSSCATKVLSFQNSFAYFFSATRLSGSNPAYIGIFDAEAYNAPAGSVGDSAAARYGNSPFSFGTHAQNSDLFITRSSTSFPTATAPNGAVQSWGGNSTYMNGGASNVQLINIGGNWAAYWINVKQDGNVFRHYTMMSWFGTGDSSINNISGAFWRTLQTNDGFDITQGLVNQPVLNAGPVFDEAGGVVKSVFGAPNEGSTQGLIGQMTTGPDGKVYYFYLDCVPNENGCDLSGNGHSYLYRREVRPYLSWMSPAQQVADLGAGIGGTLAQTMVNYHATLGKWVVIYACDHMHLNAWRTDYCARTFPTMAALGNFNPGPNDYSTYGLHLVSDANLPTWNGQNFIGQPGIRKNPQGQHFTDADGAVIMYFPVGPDIAPWSIEGIYAKKIYLQ